MDCPTCGTSARPGLRFCSQCGGRLDLACPACGAPHEAGDRFCGACGAGLTRSDASAPAVPAAAAGTPPPSPHSPATPDTEVRLLSVLFLDLVGFTTLSEGRDPEDLRELLDRYFDRSRRIVARYGGTVAKFIGDAVLAVWGSPVAHDDDAERAVRAALDLVAEVVALGEAEGIAGLQARAGVTTGRVAVTVGAEHEGMVVGDRVNTASRIQGLAEPGAVLVDDTTRRGSADAIAYEDTGEHTLRGKDERVRTWRAKRVVARVGGAVRAQGLEPPFVGRERELRLVKDVFETVADQGSAAMVAVVGQAGIGKSRLAWEFEKHIDGLVQSVYWHRGRCLAYGDGVAYNALAEMVRVRADIGDDEDPSTARRKLSNAVERHVADPADRDYMLPRLAQLLGLEDRTAPDQADIFPAWRLFFENLAVTNPVVLLFEDLQWADRGLLDFVDHLLDWARDRSILVLCLTRPEIADRVDWASRVRNLTTIRLEPLTDAAMDDLLAGLVPGLPAGLKERIARQAEGIPLYAVETVRMLLDRGELLPGENGYELAGEIDALAVPETLQTLVAARLDGLQPQARDLLQHAAVLGQTFGRDALAAMSGLDDVALDEGLRSLRAKDLVGLDTTTRGPDGARYVFLQSIVRTVAFDMISRQERKRRHLAAARHLETLPTADELAEVIASHYVDAYRCDPDGDDAAEIRSDALRMLRRAADRAESLAAVEDAQRCCDAAVELTDDTAVRAEALLRAGSLAHRAGRTDDAQARLREAVEIFRERGDTRQEALAESWLSRIDFDEGRTAEAAARLEAAATRLDAGTSPAEYARIASELGRLLYFLGRGEEAADWLEHALVAAEALPLRDVVCDALNTKSLVLYDHGRAEEAIALMRHANRLGDDVNAYVAHRATNNLTILLFHSALWDEMREETLRGLERARRDGDRQNEAILLTKLGWVEAMTGNWDDSARYIEEASNGSTAQTRFVVGVVEETRYYSSLERGDLEAAREILEARLARGVTDEQERQSNALAQMHFHHAAGEHRAAVDVALALSENPRLRSDTLDLDAAIESALALGDLDTARELRSRMASFLRPTMVVGTLALRLSDARIAAAEGAQDAEQMLRDVVADFDTLGMPVHAARVRIDLAELLAAKGSDEDAAEVCATAARVLTDVGARPKAAEAVGLLVRLGRNDLVPAGADVAVASS